MSLWQPGPQRISSPSSTGRAGMRGWASGPSRVNVVLSLSLVPEIFCARAGAQAQEQALGTRHIPKRWQLLPGAAPTTMLFVA